jgi:hypothetical protein
MVIAINTAALNVGTSCTWDVAGNSCNVAESRIRNIQGVRLVEWKRQLERYWPQALMILTILGAIWLYFAFAPEAN